MAAHVVELRHPQELLVFLEAASRAFSGGATGPVLLLPVRCPDERIVGTSSAQVYESRTADPADLSIHWRNEYVPREWRTRHVIHDDGMAWTFQVHAGGPLRDRIHRVNGGRSAADLSAAVRAGAEEVRWRRADVDARPAGLPRWQACGLCTPPQRPGTASDEPPQPSSSFFEIVGAPHFHDHHDRGWCLKRCPSCGTCYLWESDYEYLAGGSESSISLRRLDDAEAEKTLAKVMETVRGPSA